MKKIKLCFTGCILMGLLCSCSSNQNDASAGNTAVQNDTGRGYYNETSTVSGVFSVSEVSYTSAESEVPAASDTSDMHESIVYSTGKGECAKIEFEYVEGATYDIYRSDDGSYYKQIDTLENDGEIVYFDTDVVAGSTYKYIVAANAGGATCVSSEDDAYAEVTMQLTDPTIIGFEKTDGGYILSWTKIKYADSYIVYEKQNDEWVQYESTAETDCLIPDSDSGYEFTVQAIGENITSIYGDDTYQYPQNNLNGKKILVFGDSVTRGSSILDPDYKDPTYTGSTIAARVKIATDADVTENGVSFLLYGQDESHPEKTMSTIIENEPEMFAGYDLIYLSLGSNDFKLETPLGSTADSESDMTYCGQIKNCIRLIREQSPDAVIILCTPTMRMKTGYGRDFRNIGYGMENSQGDTLRDYCEKMIETAALYDNVYAYDSESSGVLTPENIWEGCNDGLHLTQKYYAKIGQSWAEYGIEILSGQAQ